VSTACLHPNTTLQTSAGSLSIKEVVERFNKGEEIKVLSYNEYTSQSEFKKVIWGDKTREGAKLMRIKDKEGNEIRLTPDHRVLVKDKGWIDTKDIVKGDKIININL
jgi:intein/homing endonuclease